MKVVTSCKFVDLPLLKLLVVRIIHLLHELCSDIASSIMEMLELMVLVLHEKFLCFVVLLVH